MKLVAAFACLGALLVTTVAMALPGKNDPRLRQTIEVTSTTVDSNVDFEGDTHELRLLWNLSVTQRPIGHAYVSCESMQDLGGYGENWYCIATYVFPLGKIVVAGPRHNRKRAVYTVIGGTGAYLGKSGFLRVTSHGPAKLHLHFKLT